MKTLKDFDLELGRGGDETMEVPTGIAQEYGVFSEDVGGEEVIREAVWDHYTNDW